MPLTSEAGPSVDTSTSAAPAGPTPPHSNAVPAETMPTWEMELLISGATAFALMQLPSKLDALLYDLINRVSSDLSRWAILLWAYAKIGVVLLIATFVLHLCLRAYWVALVGLNSVYPDGIRAPRLKLGAVQTRLVESHLDMPARIEAADNTATCVFGVGFGLAMTMVRPFALVLSCTCFALAVNLIHVQDLDVLVPLLIGACGAPFVLVRQIDRRWGARIAPSGRLGRALLATFKLYEKIGFGADANPLVALFRSNEQGTRISLISRVAIVAVVVLTTGQTVLQVHGKSVFFNQTGLPRNEVDAADVLVPQHYASLRGDEPSSSLAAFIPDKIAQGPYLELNVPYRPASYAAALRAACPNESAAAGMGRSARPALDCLARIGDDPHLESRAWATRADGRSRGSARRELAPASSRAHSILALGPPMNSMKPNRLF